MRNAIALLLLIWAGNAAALTCLNPTVEERYRQHRHVALVEVTAAQIEESEGFSRGSPFASIDSIEVTADRTRPEPRWRRIVATIRVLESFKGQDTPTRLVLTRWGEHPEITVGSTYLMFLDDANVSLDCDGMPHLSPGEPDDVRLVETLAALERSGELPPERAAD